MRWFLVLQALWTATLTVWSILVLWEYLSRTPLACKPTPCHPPAKETPPPAPPAPTVSPLRLPLSSASLFDDNEPFVSLAPLFRDVDSNDDTVDRYTQCVELTVLEGGSTALLDGTVRVIGEWATTVTHQSPETRRTASFGSREAWWSSTTRGHGELRAAQTGVTLHFATLNDAGLYMLHIRDATQHFFRCYQVGVIPAVEPPTLEVLALDRLESASCMVTVSCSLELASGAVPRVIDADRGILLRKVQKLETTETHRRHVATVIVSSETTVRCAAVGSTGSAVSAAVHLGRLCREATATTILDSVRARELHPNVSCRAVATELTHAVLDIQRLREENANLKGRPVACPTCPVTVMPGPKCPLPSPPIIDSSGTQQFMWTVVTVILLLLLFVVIFAACYVVTTDGGESIFGAAPPGSTPPMIPLADVAHLIPPAPAVQPPPPPYSPPTDDSVLGAAAACAPVPQPRAQMCPGATPRFRPLDTDLRSRRPSRSASSPCSAPEVPFYPEHVFEPR